MARGGFDCVLGNPPWERIKLQEKEFFAARSEAIATALNKAARERLIKALSALDASEADRQLVLEFQLAKREAEGSGEFIRGSGRFALTAVGDLNTYALFAEHFLNLIAHQGRSGIIVPSGIATDYSCRNYFQHLVSGERLISLLAFDNALKIFPSVHPDTPFSLVTLGESDRDPDFTHYALSVHHLSDVRRHFVLSTDDIALINPNTRTCPVFRSQMDAQLTKKIYAKVPVLIDEAMGEQGNPWGIKFMRMLDMANDSHLFIDEPAAGYLPLYEAKLIHHFDHRWATYEADGSSRDVTLMEKQNPYFEVNPRYWVERKEVEDRLNAQHWGRQWLMGWRDITNATNERTAMASVIDLNGVGHTMPLFLSPAEPRLLACHLGNWQSLVLDFVARGKIGGTHLTYFFLKQFPFLSPSGYEKNDVNFIVKHILELTYTSHGLKYWAQDLGYEGAPFAYDPERRAFLRAELDSYYAHLYGLSRDELHPRSG
jgi:hypothetical protein